MIFVALSSYLLSILQLIASEAPIQWEELNKDSNRLEGLRQASIVHRAKDVTKLQQELKDMGEDEDFDFEYEDADDDEDFDYEYEEIDWDDEPQK